jgi:hypothetical protein
VCTRSFGADLLRLPRTCAGDGAIDRVLSGFVGAFEAAFPGRVRAYTIAGSYAEGSYAERTAVLQDGQEVLLGPSQIKGTPAVLDVAVDGRPAHPDRLHALFPRIATGTQGTP